MSYLKIPQHNTIFAVSNVDHTVTGTVNETEFFRVTIPGGTLGPNGMLRVTTLWTNNNSGTSKTMRIKYGAGNLLSSSTTTLITSSAMHMMRNRNSEGSQIAGIAGFGNFSSNSSAHTTFSVDSSVAQDLVITGQLAATGDTLTLNSVVVEVLT